MATEFGTGKTLFILAIVFGCFAILWPKIFYPMLQSSVEVKPNIIPTTESLRQERPPHLRPTMIHPALREKGRAIPHSHIVPRVTEPEAPAAPIPMPGMRPPMGGAGHVVPAPKGSSTMGIIMPMYTIGIVIFFMYTMMKLLFKKSEESNAYKDFEPDPEFRRVVFSNTEYSNAKNHKEIQQDDNTKLVVSAISGLVAEVNRDILSKQDVEPEGESTEEAVAEEHEKEEVKVKEEEKEPKKMIKSEMSGGPMIAAFDDNNDEEDEEDDEGLVEEVSEDEAEADNDEINLEEDMTTNYTTASGPGLGGNSDETAADFSTMETHHDDEVEEEELEDDIVQTKAKVPVTPQQEEDEDEEEVEEEEEEEEELEEEVEDEVGRPQSLQRQHQR